MITTAPELIYMLKVNIGIALFYAFYKLFCCRDTFFQWRRIALLSFLALSFLYPLMDMQAWVKEQPAINELADYYTLMMLTETNTSTATVVTTPVAIPTPGLLDIIKFIYWIGILLLSARFMIQLSSIFHLVLKSKSINVDQISIRSLSEPANPFSFWQWIFVYLPELKEDEKQEILTHEQTHVRQWHSIDVIISEIVNIICWMNPFAWLMKTEIRLNLEYLADHKVMESGTNKKAYQYHLLAWEYKSANPGKVRLDMRAYFKGMGEELLRMFIFLSGSSTEVIFTEEQWKEHTERFRTYLREVVAEDDDSPGAIVLRHGLMMSRIAMVLTALRKCEPQWNTSEWKCSDEDFRTAMQIVDVLLEHSLLLSTSMDDTAGRIRPVKAFFKLRPILRTMPREFTYSELMAAANEAGLPTASVKRYLLRLVYYQIVEKEDGKYRKTGKSWPKLPPK